MKMGRETDSSHWNNPYLVQFPFVTYDARHFFFGHDTNSHYWFIQELLDDGKMGRETDKGYWRNAYQAMFAFTIKGKTFCFGQSHENRYWFIQRLNDDGTLGSETANGYWQHAYNLLVPYWVDNKLFCFGQDHGSGYWFIQELKSDGTLGTETADGYWKGQYGVAFPFQVAGQTYLLAQDLNSKYWFISELKDDGTFGDTTADGYWNGAYPAMFSCNLRGNQCFYGQDTNSRYWFIQDLLTGGKLGDQTDEGYWKFKYDVQFPFERAGRQFFYGNSLYGGSFNNFHWFIQELLSDSDSVSGEVGAASSDWAAKVYIWSYRGLTEAVGHAALELSDGTYISWWPKDMTPRSLADVADGFKKTANDPQTYDDDIRLEGFGPDVVIEIPYKREGGLDTSAIKTWWSKFKGNPDNKYRLLTQNCATTVKDALAAGGAWNILSSLDYQSFKKITIWVPADAENLAGRLRSKLIVGFGTSSNAGETEGRPPQSAPGPAMA